MVWDFAGFLSAKFEGAIRNNERCVPSHSSETIGHIGITSIGTMGAMNTIPKFEKK